MDIDRGSSAGTLMAKQAKTSSVEVLDARAEDRSGYAELDSAIEQAKGLSRATRDKQRAVPLPTPEPATDPRMVRKLPVGPQVRRPASTRQRAARSKTKREVQDGLSGAQHREIQRLIVDERGRWDQVNDALSDVAGDVQQLPDAQIGEIQRIDRSIRAYERENDRGHVVYSNVVMPSDAHPLALTSYTRKAFPVGEELAFDRFTMGAHSMHEVEHPDPYNRRVVAMEIQTSRGMYLGQSGGGTSSLHLLPRGMHLWVRGVRQAEYQRPDGTVGRRTVLQLSDQPPPATTKSGTKNRRRRIS